MAYFRRHVAAGQAGSLRDAGHADERKPHAVRVVEATHAFAEALGAARRARRPSDEACVQ